MPNSINSLSPDFRDFLLERNVITDTIENNGLLPLLQGIGYPSEVFINPETVQPSVDIEEDGEFYKDLNVVNNKFQAQDDDYTSIDVVNLPGSTEPFSVTTDANFYQDLNVTQNTFRAQDNDYVDTSMYLNSSAAPTIQMGAYLDEFGNLNIGGPSTQPLDIIGSILGGNAIGFDPTGGGAVPDFDVRSSLAGRVLTGVGAINDTKLGQLSVGFLAAALGNNVAFNIQQETLGHIDLNPLNLIKGGNVIRPNFNITVAKGTLGVAVDLLERILGFETPVSLLERSSSIFPSESGDISTLDRANSMIENTGKGQVLALFANLNANSDENLIGERIGYVPAYEDARTERGFNQGPLDGGHEIYAFNENAKLEKYSKDLEGGFNDEFDELDKFTSNNLKSKDFTWFDTNLNAKRISRDEETLSNMPNDTPDFDVKKGLLYKTQELFRTNKMRTLTVGHGVNVEGATQTQSSVAQGFMSKGSAVLSETALTGEGDLVDASSIFCRTWTTYDRYNQVQDLQKHSGLDPLARQNGEEYPNSVLDDNGFVRIGPYEGEEIKKFMFSIENLAWIGETDKLLPCEVGEGDLLTGNKGRIMWFPPYDISFNETTSVSWDKNNFIGRGEPIYTYNNTERTGTLSWKIVVDHPNYMNFMDDLSVDEINSFFAGCLRAKGIRERILSADEQEKMKVAEVVKQPEKTDDEVINPIKFNIYFANDNSDIPTTYENGLKNGSDTPTEKINYDESPAGVVSTPVFIPGAIVPVLVPTDVNYGLGTTVGQGPVGTVGRDYIDNTNFGLNGQSKPINIDGEVFEGWQDPNFTTKLNSYLKEKCKYCKVNIIGRASTPGAVDKNQQLSENRANSVKEWLLNTSGIIPTDDEFREKRVGTKARGAGESDSGSSGCIDGQEYSLDCKLSRVTSIEIVYDPTLKEEAEPTPTAIDFNDTPPNLPTIPISRFYSECHYFEKLEQTDNVVYENIKQKIRYFHPGFHSITPEGFNSRLTFLQQCTRQGPTNKAGNPDNLAFGRPPVCILRIGDFYHTKIIIDNLTFDYDPLVWDLNPEGVGVQPMIVTVNMSFAFIGGSSLNSPINKLQNAVSFNYFANTEVYDPRAEKVILKTELTSDKEAPGELVLGTFPNSPNVLQDSDVAEGINTNTNVPTLDQETIAEFEAIQDAIEMDEFEDDANNDVKVISEIMLDGFFKTVGDEDLTLSLRYAHKSNSTYTLKNGTYSANIVVNSLDGMSNINVGSIVATPNGDGSFILVSKSSNGDEIDEVIINKDKRGNFQMSVELSEEDDKKVDDTIALGLGILKVDWTTGHKTQINLRKEIGV